MVARIMERMEHMDLKRVKVMECPEWECGGVLWQCDSVTQNVGDVRARLERNMIHDNECRLKTRGAQEWEKKNKNWFRFLLLREIWLTNLIRDMSKYSNIISKKKSITYIYTWNLKDILYFLDWSSLTQYKECPKY